MRSTAELVSIAGCSPTHFCEMAMPDLPSSTVTLLFTDIEGSTRLLQRLLRAAFAQHGGREVDT